MAIPEFDEDFWYDQYLNHKCMYENIKEAQGDSGIFDESLHDELVYHSAQLMTCVEELKKLGTEVEVPEELRN